MQLTDEQKHAVDVALTGNNFALEALAGTGKTTTLKAIAEVKPTDQGLYVAFNKAIQKEAEKKFPANVESRTLHSLAHEAVRADKPWFIDRMANAEKLKYGQVASLLGIGALVVPHWSGTGSRQLKPSRLAGYVLAMVRKFCMTDADEITSRMMPRVEGIDKGDEWTIHNMIADHIVGYAHTAWRDICSPNGKLTFEHSHYLKMFQLMKPTLPFDFILVDECQPPETVVSLPGGGTKKIIDIQEGDNVVSWRKGRGLNEKQGNRVLGKTVRHYEGDMIHVECGTLETDYTPNHICMARIGASFADKISLYLMKKDGAWRVGIAQGVHGSGPGRSFGPYGRMREEGAEALWVLDTFEDKATAALAEQTVSLKWRIPQATFSSDFWHGWDATLSDPEGCLSEFGRDFRYPMLGGERRYMLADRFTEIRACNLFDGMEMMHADDLTLRPIRVSRIDYVGDVVSLDVENNKTYVGDGLVTHNCQDLNPVMLAILSRQTNPQMIAVGDQRQQIYEWNGAVNALAQFPGERAWLTKSFRFGPEIAGAANFVLETMLGETVKVEGLGGPSRVGYLDAPNAVLSRRNATAIRRAAFEIGLGKKVHLVGGGTEISKFAYGALDLMAGRWCSHPELTCFADWEEVLEYVNDDDIGSDLEGKVRLVNDLGALAIIDTVKACSGKRGADVVISTAHKSKGLEWPGVSLTKDLVGMSTKDIEFDETKMTTEDKRLLYVAVTRAEEGLDVSALPPLAGLMA